MVCISRVYYQVAALGALHRYLIWWGPSLVCPVSWGCSPATTAADSCTATDSVGGRISGKNNGPLILLCASVFGNVGSFTFSLGLRGRGHKLLWWIVFSGPRRPSSRTLYMGEKLQQKEMLDTGGPVCSGHVCRSSKEVPFLLEQGACP